MPCYKLGVRFGGTDVIRRFIVSGRSGIYFKVVEEGEVKTGEKIKVIKRDKNNITVKILSVFMSLKTTRILKP
jgi:MOSC domain-containing protein YiiM